jgi:hypothetical protein
MPFPKKICAVCEEEFELKPGKPGFANRCPECSVADEADPASSDTKQTTDREQAAARRHAMKDLLYRKDS